MTVIQMSERELTRLRVLIDLSDKRLTVEAAGTLIGLGRRQVYRLRRGFAVDGATAVVSRKRGRPSNHRHCETFRRTVLCMSTTLISVRRSRWRSWRHGMACASASRLCASG
jgi:hypothetical protein